MTMVKQVADLRERLEAAEIALYSFNSGAEVQSIMRLNNELVAERSEQITKITELRLKLEREQDCVQAHGVLLDEADARISRMEVALEAVRPYVENGTLSKQREVLLFMIDAALK